MQKEDGKITVGILALQGSFVEHKKMIETLGHKTLEVRKVDDLEKIDGLIIPGGESTTMNHHLALNDFRKKLIEAINGGLPVYGTCAGSILMAKNVDGEPNLKGLAVMNIDVERNAYGAQLDSFEEEVEVNLEDGVQKIPAIYIRAPKINSVGDSVEILCKNNAKEIVMARQKNMLVTTFHPELTKETLVHEYFVEKIIQTS